MKRKITIAAIVVAASAVGAATYAQNAKDAGANWPLPLGNPGASRYSTLTKINTSNVTQLKRAWTFHTGSGRFVGAPMVIDSVMYFSANNGVYALDAVTGTQIWKYAPDASQLQAPRPEGAPAAFGHTGEDGGERGPGDAGTGLRGPTYWPGTKGVGPRIYSSIRSGMAAIDAKTGTLVTSFATNGVLMGITPDSPPSIYRNVLITHGDFEPGKGKTIRGWDIVTGKPLWVWYAKAQPGDPNREKTWLDGSADSNISTDIWGTTTVDVERGLVYVPTETTSGQGPHPGDNLYTDSVVALDALTGKMKWYQQQVHAPQGDNDMAAAPVLIDVRRNGKVIPALAEYTKMSLLFMYNRVTGEPIFGIEERPVPVRAAGGRGSVPTEDVAAVGGNAAGGAGRGGRGAVADAAPAAAPAKPVTQPFPIKPLALAPYSAPYGVQVMNPPTITPEIQAFCDSLKDTPRVLQSIWRNGGAYGWQGVTYHRGLGLLITNAATPPQATRCVPPPWMELVAINVNTGDVAWRVPLGQFDELTAKGVPPTGTPSAGASIATAGNLVFIGGSADGYFRAFDARNGKELWRDKLPHPAHGTPSTYLGRDGKQYVVVGANGASYIQSPGGDDVIAYTLQ